MDIKQFEPFDKVCSEHLAGVIDKILSEERKESACAIGFITTDDFYGFYLTWHPGNDTKGCESWEKALYPDFLYTPLVEIVDACDDIDFCKESDKNGNLHRHCFLYLKKISGKFLKKFSIRITFNGRTFSFLQRCQTEIL